MSGLATVGSMVVGSCDHGSDCCPHPIIGNIALGSPNVMVGGLGGARVTDFVTTNCPHCGMGICATGAPNTKINNLAAHRIGDMVTLGAGVGTTVMGASNVIAK